MSDEQAGRPRGPYDQGVPRTTTARRDDARVTVAHAGAPGEEPRPAIRLRGSLAPLGYRNFALYWVGFLASNTGKNIELVGSVWLVSELTQSALMLGLLGLARSLPQLVLSPVAGVIADRVDQRRLLFLTQALAMAASTLVWILVVTGRVEVWQVYVEVVAQSAIQAFDAADRQALWPRLVPRSLLPDAVTLSVTGARSAAFIGPVIGGVAIATLGVAAPFGLNALTFLALMAGVVLMRNVPDAPRGIAASFRNELMEGLHYIRRTPLLRGLMRLEVVSNIFAINTVIITIVGRQVLDVGPEGLGGLLAADALGSIIGVAGVLVVGQPTRQGRFSVLCTLGYCGVMVVFALSPWYAMSFVALATSGVMDVLTAVTRNTIMQLSAPGHLRGRLMANMRVITGGIGPLAETQSGFSASLLGGPLALGVAAFALALAAGWTARSSPAFWTFSRDEPAPEPSS